MARIKLDLHSRSHQHIENKDKHTFPEKTQFKASLTRISTSLTIFFIHLQLLFQCNVSILLHTGPNIFCFGYWHTGRRNQTLYIWYITKSWQLGYPWKGLSKCSSGGLISDAYALQAKFMAIFELTIFLKFVYLSKCHKDLLSTFQNSKKRLELIRSTVHIKKSVELMRLPTIIDGPPLLHKYETRKKRRRLRVGLNQVWKSFP